MSQPSLPRLRTSRSSIQDDAAGEAATPIARSPWALGLASVLFDVDKGQTLRDLWPPDCLSEEEKAAVAFHAFPDSLSMELYTRNAIRDSSFSFRIKREPESFSSAGVPEFLNGYVFCRQRQDETLRRGGEQVSVVVLATSPFSGALLPLSQAAGHAFFNEGPLALAMMYNQVLAWPPPVPGSTMYVPLGATIANVRVPHFCLLPPPQPAVDPAVQATLARRLSRSLSRKQSGSPRVLSSPAPARSGSPASGSGELSTVLGASAAATTASPAAAAGEPGLEGRQPEQAAEEAAVAAASPSKGDAVPAEVAAAAAADGNGAATSGEEAGWALVGEGSQQEQQQGQGQESGMSSRGSFGSLLGLSRSTSRANSSCRLSRPDLAASGNAGSGSSAAAAAAAADSSVSNGAMGGSSSSDWLVSTLGQQWRDEKPFPEVEPAIVLAPLLRDLWTLWQLVVTAQPLMVVGLTPGETSAAVAALASLIAPLPYAADHRPYFTIHDPDFVALASGQLLVRQRYHEVLPQQGQQQPQEQAQGPSPPQEQQQGAQQQTEQPPLPQQPPDQAAGKHEDQPGAEDPQQPAAPGEQDKQPPSPQQQQQQLHRKRPKHLNLPALIGITNLYFLKALPKWPNVVAVSRKELVTPPPSVSSRSDSPAKSSAANSSAGGGAAAAAADGSSPAGAGSAGGSSFSASPAAAPAHARSGSGSGAGFFSSTAAAAVRALQRRQQGPQHLLSHFAPHLWTHKHVQCVKPDHTLLSKARAAIEPAVGSSGAAAAAAGVSSSSGGSSSALGPGTAAGTAAARLRRHFAELTAALLAPLEVYFTPGPTGKVPAWRPEAFLSSLDPAALPPALTARLSGNAATAAAALYAAFIESPNFAFWFRERRAPVLHLVEDEPESDEEDDGFAKVAAGAGDISDAGVQSDPDEVELVQQLLSTEQALLDWQQLGREQRAGAMQQEQALQLQVVQTFLQLPRDLQGALFSSPARQEQLQDAAAALAGGRSDEQAAAAAVLQKMQALMLGDSSPQEQPGAAECAG